MRALFLVLLLAALFFVPSASAERGLALPTCTEFNGRTVLLYQNREHMFLDFCENDRGINTVAECKAYFSNSNIDLLRKELLRFQKARLAKICGK